MEWEQRRTFRKLRNRIAHAYSETQAKMIAEAVPAFITAAQDLHDAIENKQRDEENAGRG